MSFAYIMNHYLKKYNYVSELANPISKTNMNMPEFYKFYIFYSSSTDPSMNSIPQSDLYVKIFKTHKILSNFCKRYKYKKYIRYNYDLDLCFEPLSKYKKSHKVDLLQNKTIYTFRISDLINLWCIALYNCDGLFPKPLKLKNPHTNVEFKLHNLYNLYFAIMDSGFHIPHILSFFFSTGFNLTELLKKHYTFLKQNAIDSYVTNSSDYDAYETLTNMLYCYRKYIDYKTVISRPTRKEAKASIKTFKKLITIYLNYKYSCNPTIKNESYTACKVRLIELFEDNSFEGFSIVKDMISYNSDNRTTTTSVALSDSDDESETDTTQTTITPRPPPPPPTANRVRRRNTTSTNIQLPSMPPPPPPAYPSAYPSALQQVNSILRRRTILPSIPGVTNTSRRRSVYTIQSSNESSPLFTSSISDVILNEFNLDSSRDPFQPSRELQRSPRSQQNSNSITSRYNLNRSTSNSQNNTRNTSNTSNTSQTIRNNFNIFPRNT